MTVHKTITTLCAAFLLSAGVLGCQTQSGPARLDQATNSVAAMRDTLQSAQKVMEDTVAALKVVRDDENIRANFDAFSGSVDDLARAARRTDSSMNTVRARCRDHLRAWDRELAEVASEQARESGRSRRDAFETQLKDLEMEFEQLQTMYNSFASDLRDTRRLLSNDLTGGGLASISSFMLQIDTRAEGVRKAIAGVNGALDRIETNFAVTTPAPPQQGA